MFLLVGRIMSPFKASTRDVLIGETHRHTYADASSLVMVVLRQRVNLWSWLCMAFPTTPSPFSPRSPPSQAPVGTGYHTLPAQLHHETIGWCGLIVYPMQASV